MRDEVLKVYPDAYAAFLGSGHPQGWIIRRGAIADFQPLTWERRETEAKAWADVKIPLA